MSREKKVVINRFSAFRYDKEQEYLANMYAKGWKLKKIEGKIFYHFVKCEPEEVVYQMDYSYGDIDDEEYIQLYADCGWEYVCDRGCFTYFIKPVSKMDGNEEIFCDLQSRISMLRRMLGWKVLPLAIITALITSYIIRLTVYVKVFGFDAFVAVVIGVWMILLVELIFSWVNFKRLKKKLNAQGEK